MEREGNSCAPRQEEGLELLDHRLRRCGHFVYHHSAGERQRKVLTLLGESGSMSQKDLQEAMDVQAGSISEMISKLESKGLVERSRDGADRRRVTISLTERGRKLQQADTRELLERRYRALTEAEQGRLSVLLEKLLQSWEEDRG